MILHRTRAAATLLLTVWAFAACKDAGLQKARSYDRAYIDSIASERLMEISMQAADQLDSRMSIEVKQKADSIVAARTAPPKKDSSTVR